MVSEGDVPRSEPGSQAAQDVDRVRAERPESHRVRGALCGVVFYHTGCVSLAAQAPRRLRISSCARVRTQQRCGPAGVCVCVCVCVCCVCVPDSKRTQTPELL